MCPARFPIGLVNVSGQLTYPPPFIFLISQASPEKVPLSLAFRTVPARRLGYTATIRDT